MLFIDNIRTKCSLVIVMILSFTRSQSCVVDRHYNVECQTCTGQMIGYTLRYDGGLGDNVYVEFTDDAVSLFIGTLSTDDVFNVTGSKADKFSGDKFRFYDAPGQQYGEILTKCVDTAVPGEFVFEYFEVCDAFDKTFNAVCDCRPCSGSWSVANIEYIGAEDPLYLVVRDEGKTADAYYFQGNVSTGELITFDGDATNGRFGGNKLFFYRDDAELDLIIQIDTRCDRGVIPSEDIVAGMFHLVGAESDGSGNMCPIHTPIATQPPTPATTALPTQVPTPIPTGSPTPIPTLQPIPVPTQHPTPSPTQHPIPSPTQLPTPPPTQQPTPYRTFLPTYAPTRVPTSGPTLVPTSGPTLVPTLGPTLVPIPAPTSVPTLGPTVLPVPIPTLVPTLLETEQSPSVVGAWFWPSGSGINIEFDRATNKANLRDFTTQNCEALFSSATLVLLGDSALCGWTSASTISITLSGSEAILIPQSLDVSAGQTLSHLEIINVNVGNILNTDLVYVPADDPNPLHVQIPADVDKPLASLSCPGQINKCADLELDGRLSTGFAGREATYLWSTDCDIDGFKNVTSDPYQIVDMDPVPLDTNCVFGLNVRNFMEIESDLTSKLVLKSDEDVPILNIRGAELGFWKTNEGHSLVAEVSFNECDDDGDDNDGQAEDGNDVEDDDDQGEMAISFLWSAVDISENNEVVDLDDDEFNNLYFTRYTLQVGHQYQITVAVTSTITVSDNVIVTIIPSALVADISGAEVRQIFVQQSLTLDASGSTDPDINPQDFDVNTLIFSWECSYFSRDVDDISIENIAPPGGVWIGCAPGDPTLAPSPILQISGLSTTRTYQFRVSVSVSNDDRSASDEVIIIPVEDDVPEIQIEGDTFLHTSQKLSLTAIILNAEPNDVFTYVWSETAFGLLSQPQINALRSTEEGGRSLVLGSGALHPNLDYVFQISATGELGFTGVASVTVRVGAGPVITGFTARLIETNVINKQLNDANGQALLSTYQLETSAYATFPETLPFSYRFSYYTDDPILETTLAGPQPSPVARVRLIAGELTLVAHVDDSNGGSSSMYLSQQITVEPIQNVCELDFLVDNLLKESLLEQDVDRTLQILEIAARMLNDESYSDNCEDDDLRRRLFEDLHEIWNTQNHPSLGQAQHLSQTLESLMQDPSALTIVEVSLAMDLVDSIFDAAEQSSTINEGILFTASIASILSLALEVELSESDDEFCDVLNQIQSHLQRLLKSELGPLVAGENPAYIEADNIIATALKVDGGDDTEAELSDFLDIRIEISGDPSDANAETSSVSIYRISAALSCYCDEDLCPEEDTLVDIVVDDEIDEVVFNITFTRNSTANTTGCGESYQEEDPQCRWWDEVNQAWASEGCETVEIVDLDDDQAVLQCKCEHLTKFAVIKEYRLKRANPCEGATFDVAFILAFAVIYSLVGSVAIVRIILVVRYTGAKSLKLSRDMLIHLLVILSCICQVVWLVLYYQVIDSSSIYNLNEADDGDIVAITIFVAISTITMYWIFSGTIFSWAKIAHRTMKSDDGAFNSGETREAVLKWAFIFANFVISLVLLVMLILLGTADVGSSTFQSTAVIGDIIVSVVSITTAIAFIIYGVLLIRKFNQSQGLLDEKQRRSSTRRIFLISLILSFTFIVESVITFVGAVNQEALEKNFVLLQASYFTFDVLSLCIVLIIFKNLTESVTTQREQSTYITRQKTERIQRAKSDSISEARPSVITEASRTSKSQSAYVDRSEYDSDRLSSDSERNSDPEPIIR